MYIFLWEVFFKYLSNCKIDQITEKFDYFIIQKYNYEI